MYILQNSFQQKLKLLLYRYIGEVKTERTHGQTTATQSNVLKKKNPIITVTEHTPTPSPDYLSKTRQVGMTLTSQIE